MTHDNYMSIPHSKEIEIAVSMEELNAIDNALDVIFAERERNSDEFTGKGRLLKGLEKRKEGQMSKLKQLQSRKDPVLTFDSIGIDFLCVDEADVFKNLEFTTRLDNVAGLSQSSSKRALQLLYGVRAIQAKQQADKGVVFASGTAISNSIAELYLIFKFLIPTHLNELGLKSFDSFQRQFCRIIQDYELTVTGETKLRTRLNEYINLPELTALWKQIAHVITHEDMKQLISDLPKQMDELIIVEPIDEQREFTAGLQLAIENEDWTYLGVKNYTGEMTENDVKAKMLLACSLNNKMAIDMRLVDKDLFQHTQSPKLDRLIDEVVISYQQYNSERGTQLIFLDEGVPGGKSMNLYEEIRKRLSEKGIPKYEVTFMQSYNKETRPELFEKMNNGYFRVLIGSTGTMGAGINVQRKVIAMHHLSIPWRPRDLTQRTGRGVRQKNELGKKYGVKNKFYAVKNTLDEYRFNIISIKQRFIDQILQNKLGLRRLSESSLGQDDDSITLSYSEIVAIMSGDKRLVEKSKTEKAIDELLTDKKFISSRAAEAQRTISSLEEKITAFEQNSAMAKDAIQAKALIDKMEENDITSFITLSNEEQINGSKEVGEYLKSLSKKSLLNEEFIPKKIIPLHIKVGEFELTTTMVERQNNKELRFYLKGCKERLYTSVERSYSSSEASQLGLFIKDALKNAIRFHKTAEKEVEEAKVKIQKLSFIAEGYFEKEDELAEKQDQLEKLKADLIENPVKNPLEQIKKSIELAVSELRLAGKNYRFGDSKRQSTDCLLIDMQFNDNEKVPNNTKNITY